MSVARRLATLLLLTIILIAPRRPALAQSSGDMQYFPETGHNVQGDFLRFYKSTKNPLLVFGYPITEQITSMDGKTVQYFQRARFELRADLPENQRIQLTILGQATYKPGNQQLNIDNPSACELFPTSFRVCFAFLDFYKSNGGVSQFGNPISPFEFQDNLIVQYFEKARFEWRADRPEGQRVVLTDLGRMYFDRLAENQTALRPINPINATIENILSIQARAFVSRAIMRSTGQQTVYILVKDQTQLSVGNAIGKATVRFTDGRTEEYYFTTNASGLGSVTFNFADQTQGELVTIEILVTYQGLSATTTTSFRVWF